MKYKHILVTGARGFIGFNALKQWRTKYPDVEFVALDSNSYADKFCQIQKNKWLEDNGIPLYSDIYLETIDADYELPKIIKDQKIDCIVHFSAESHVDNSISSPLDFVYSNILGTMNILEAVRKHNLRIHMVSTDEVYGTTTPSDNVYEDGKLNPTSPYAASKASADLMFMSYVKTYKIKGTISRCSNNIGKYQHYEKFIPRVIKNCLENISIPIYGDGLQKRHWISVDDHNNFIMDILGDKYDENVFNISTHQDNYVSNIDIVKFILEYLGKPMSLISYVDDRPAHDTSYFIKSKHFTGNTLLKDFLPQVIEWYKDLNQIEDK